MFYFLSHISTIKAISGHSDNQWMFMMKKSLEWEYQSINGKVGEPISGLRDKALLKRLGESMSIYGKCQSPC